MEDDDEGRTSQKRVTTSSQAEFQIVSSSLRENAINVQPKQLVYRARRVVPISHPVLDDMTMEISIWIQGEQRQLENGGRRST